jgi:hypothetical protein
VEYVIVNNAALTFVSASQEEEINS